MLIVMAVRKGKKFHALELLGYLILICINIFVDGQEGIYKTGL